MKERFEPRILTGSFKITLTDVRSWIGDKADLISNIKPK